MDGNICTDDQGTKTQEYGIVIANVDTVTVTANNMLTGNKTASIAYKNRRSRTDTGTLIRTENPLSPGPLHPGYLTGAVWYAPPFIAYAGSPAAQTADTLYLIPLVLFAEVTIGALGTRIHEGAADTQALFGIYANDVNGLPGVKLAEAPTAVSGASLASVSATLTANTKLKPGRYWLAALCDGAIRMKTLAPTQSGMAALGSTALADVTNATHVVGLSATAAFSSGLPSTLAGTLLTVRGDSTVPVVAYQTV